MTTIPIQVRCSGLCIVHCQDEVPASEPRRWLYGLTADEWLHLAAQGEESEVPPCCGNLGHLRELLNALATFQSADDTGWQLSFGRRIIEAVEGDGDGHGLADAAAFPLLHRVLSGITAQLADPDPFQMGNREGRP